MRSSFAVASLAAFVGTALAKTVVVTVADPTGGNASSVFTPQEVEVTSGDTLSFKFTSGNHTATQALFGSPCEPTVDIGNHTKGFDSGFVDVKNGSSKSFNVSITSSKTLWFFDFNTCGQGGVGGVNVNEDTNSTETLAGFTRDAMRLNGTAATSISGSLSGSASASASASGSGSAFGSASASGSGSAAAASASATAPGGSAASSSGATSPAQTSAPSSAERSVQFGVLTAIPLVVLGLLTL